MFVEDLVADLELAHYPPPTGGRYGRINREGLALQSAGQVVRQCDYFIGRGEYELVGMQDERILAFRLDQPGQVRLLDRGVDVRVAVVLEDPEVPVQPDVDAGRLDQLGFIRVEFDPPGLDLGPDVTIERSTLATYPVRYDVWANTAQAGSVTATTDNCRCARV